MPKRIKQKRAKPTRRPSDPNLWARQLVDESTAEPETAPAAPPTPDFKAQLSSYMQALGAKGGKIGGKRRLTTMTFEQRSAVGLKGARARWNKAKQAKKH